MDATSIQQGFVTMIMLDLFSGSGSASQPFLDAGWKVYRYDIEPTGADGIFIDLKEKMFVNGLIDTWKNKKVDLVWCSPPCTHYSDVNPRFHDPLWVPDTLLWNNCHSIIQEIQPKNFVIENVRGAQKTWGPAVQHFGPYYLWGVYPKFTIPDKIKPKHIAWEKNGPRYTTKRKQAIESAKIPYTIGYHLERAIRLQERFIDG